MGLAVAVAVTVTVTVTVAGRSQFYLPHMNIEVGSRAHIDQIMRDTAAHVCVPCCANAIPVSPYEQQRVESDMLFHITRLEIEVNTLKGQLAAADEEIRRLRMVELRCMCAAGVAELVDEEFISC